MLLLCVSMCRQLLAQPLTKVPSTTLVSSKCIALLGAATTGGLHTVCYNAVCSVVVVIIKMLGKLELLLSL